MADESDDRPDEIKGILADLDAVLSGLSESAENPPRSPTEAAPAKAVESPKAVEPPNPFELPKAVEPPKAAAPPKPVEPPKPVQPPKAVEPLKAAEPLKPVEPPKSVQPSKPIELPKAAEPLKPAEPSKSIQPPKAVEKAAETPKSIAPPPPVPPSPIVAKPVEPPKAVEAAKGDVPADDIPASTPKDQIRRIAYVYTFSCAEARSGFAAYLSQAARTISKKPIFLRQVMALELGVASDPFAVFEKARAAKAVAVLAVVEGWPPAKIEGLSEACARGGLLFRTVSPADVLKKSTAVDVIVDMMLLGGET